MNNTTRKIVIAIIIIVICGGLIKILNGQKKEVTTNELKEVIKLVKAEKVHPGKNTIQIPVHGKLESARKIDVFSEVNGVLISNNFMEGNAISQGEIIASLDDSELRNSVNAQKSNLLNQAAKLVADMKFDFKEEAGKWDNFLGQIDFNRPLPELPEVTDTKLKKYLAGKNLYTTYYNIKSLEDRLDKFTIVAPFSGVLSGTTLKKGTLVRAGQKLGEFIQTENFELKVSLPVKDAQKIKKGDLVTLTTNDKSGNWDGIVSRIIPKVDEISQNISVYLSVQGSGLYEGMYMFGTLNAGEVDSAVIVLRNLLNSDEIFVVNDGKLERKQIQLIQQIEDKALIIGLEEDEIILSEPVKGAFSGMKVRFEIDN